MNNKLNIPINIFFCDYHSLMSNIVARAIYHFNQCNTSDLVASTFEFELYERNGCLSFVIIKEYECRNSC